MLSTPISAPRCGSAATSRSVAALAWKSHVQARAVPIGQGSSAGEREDDVHIRHVEQIALARVEPALARLRLALRAVPIGTSYRRWPDARRRHTDRRARRARPCDTARSLQDGPLLRTQPRMLRDEGVTLRVEDIGHLHGRPAHDVLVGLRFSRDRGRTTGAGPAAAPRIRRRLEVPLRQMQVHRRVREVRVAQEDLDRPQVCAGLEQVRRAYECRSVWD